MKKFIRIMALVFSLFLVLGAFAGCGDKNDESKINIKVWAPAEDEFLISRYADGFAPIAAEKFPEYTVTIEYKTVAEPNVGSLVTTDVNNAADVFIFPDDHIISLNTINALREITPALGKDEVIARNTEKSVEAATIGDKLLAYPMTGDNTYFLIYDKRVVSATQAEKMDDILAACQAKSKKTLMDISNGWYIASFFFATGGNLSLDSTTGKLVCDWNNENGLKAAEGIKRITDHFAITTGNDDAIKSTTNELGAIVTGTWNIPEIQKKWGKENVGLAKLPTFTVGAEQVQMMSFGGHKLVGVNAFSRAGNIASAFADYMTSEEGQMMRFEERQNTPTNKVVADKDDVKNNEIVKVILEQFKHSRSQSQVTEAYWTPADAFGTVLESKDLGGKSLQELLDIMVAAITG